MPVVRARGCRCGSCCRLSGAELVRTWARVLPVVRMFLNGPGIGADGDRIGRRAGPVPVLVLLLMGGRLWPGVGSGGTVAGARAGLVLRELSRLLLCVLGGFSGRLRGIGGKDLRY